MFFTHSLFGGGGDSQQSIGEGPTKKKSELFPQLTLETLGFYDKFLSERCLKELTISGSRDVKAEYTVSEVLI